MKLSFETISPREKCIEPELLITFSVTDLTMDTIPVQFNGELFSDNGFKIGELTQTVEGNGQNLWLHADGSTKGKHNHPFTLSMCCKMSKAAINFLENRRLKDNNHSKHVGFVARLYQSTMRANMEIAHVHIKDFVAGGIGQKALYYEYVRNFSTGPTNMWILSANGGTNFLEYRSYALEPVGIAIDMMEWINKYCPYFGIGDYIVYEFLQPSRQDGDSEIASRFRKADNAILEMKKMLGYGEWNKAVEAGRPVFELFRDFDAYKSLLLNSGYNQAAFEELNEGIKHFFLFASKFAHVLERNRQNITDDISVEKEDAYFVYSFCVSILYMVSQKLRKHGAEMPVLE